VDPDFDRDAAWLRRFTADAESSLGAFARRLKEALPTRVTIRESRSLFGRGRITGVEVELGEKRYVLEVTGGRLAASAALVVHGVVLNTRKIEPAELFARLAEETRDAGAEAHALSRSLAAFMAE